jgi:hypothetical protein
METTVKDMMKLKNEHNADWTDAPNFDQFAADACSLPSPWTEARITRLKTRLAGAATATRFPKSWRMASAAALLFERFVCLGLPPVA